MKYILIFFTVISSFALFFSCKTGQTNDKRRILTLGIRHESNTFSTLPAKKTDFNILRGQEVLKDQKWAEFAVRHGVELVPTLHAYAWPGGVVEKKAFEDFKNEILDSIRNAGPVDAIYMDMHGALHAEGYDDGQAVLIKEIREIVGKDILISGSFDLHGNLSPDFIEDINIITAYRTAPHRDGAETKERALRLLLDAMDRGLRPHIEHVVIPILVPGEKSITEVEPLKSIYEQIPLVAEKEGLMDASIFAGYCWADLPRSAMRVFVMAEDEKYIETAKKEAENLAKQIWNKRQDMKLDVPSGTAEEMILKAKEYKGKTVFISDSGDNTTAGAPGDNPQVLAALLNQNTKNALVAGIVDNDAFQKCVNAGIGKNISLSLGGVVDNVFGKPLLISGKIRYITPESMIESGKGSVVLEVKGVTLVVMNARRSFTTVTDFKEIGLDPLSYDIVVVKLGYLYPELRDIAPVHLIALTSGFCNLNMRTLPFKNVTRPIYPLDLDMVENPFETVPLNPK